MLRPRLRYQSDAKPEFWLEQAYTQDTARLIEEAMEQVIASPMEPDAAPTGRISSLAGKTGTAEIKQSKTGYHRYGLAGSAYSRLRKMPTGRFFFLL